MGGGRSKFLPKDFEDHQHKKGQRLDKRDLITEWLNIDRSPGSNKAYVGNRSQLESLNVNETDYLLGKQSFIIIIIAIIMFRTSSEAINLSLVQKYVFILLSIRLLCS